MSLVLLQPTALPTRDRDLAVTGDAPAPLLLARRMAAGPAATDLLDRLRTLPAPPSGEDPADVAGKDRSYVYDDRLRAYDAYFGVVRAGRHSDGVFARALLIAYRSLLEEGLGAGTRLGWADWSSLCSALRTMICLSTGVEPAPAAVPEPPMLRWHLDPHRRWRVGHHVFFVLTQSLVVALQSFRSALEEADVAGARGNLRLAARLLRASGAAFVFTAEFSANQYHGGVRQSMEAPFVADGFSGLLSPDHQYLVRLFARLRPALRNLPEELVPDHRAFTRALGTVYDSHKYVCARFGGETAPSLRTSDATGLPAVSVLHALKLARTKIVGRT